jgi:DNA-binding transcriptional LysR family regulator
MYDLTQLKTLVTVVQEGHLTRASERLHISQPTASHHIRALEEHFGVPLFKRTSRGLEVTPAGKRIADWAGSVVQASHELDQRARQLVGVPAGRLVIGTVADDRLLSALPDAIHAMRAHFPLTELGFEAGTSWTIRQAMKTGELDAGAIVGTVRTDELKCYALGMLEYVLVGPSAWRDRLEHARPAQIAALPWILSAQGTPSREMVERYCGEQSLDINVAVEVSNAPQLRAMVAGAVGIGFMRQEQALAGVQAGSYFVVPSFRASLPLTFVHPQARASDAALRCFAEALAASCEKHALAPSQD